MKTLLFLLASAFGLGAATVNWTNTAGLDSTSYAPGDTVMLWGTFTNKYTITNSGTSGNPITFAFATGAKFTKPTFTTGAIAVNGKSYINILNGFIECTDNGTAFGNQVDSIGIDAYTGGGATSLVISNMTITNMYARTYKSATDGNRYGVGINLGAWNGLWVMDCNLSDGDTMIGGAALNGQTMTNVYLLRNTIRQCNHGMSLGTANGAASAWIKSVVVASNRVDDLDHWDNHSNLHLDGFIFFHEATSGGFKDWSIYSNEIGPNIGITNTAAIFMPVYANAAGDNIQIYNNLFTAAAGYSWNNGHVVLGYCTNSAIFNNTFFQNDRTGIGLKVSYGELAVSNNIFFNTGIAVYISGATLADFGGFIDYNVYYGSPALQFQVPLGQDTFAQWKSETGFDSNSITNQPLLDASYIPTAADTAAKNTGQNLSAWFTTDKNGVTRSDWYAGAFEYYQFIPEIDSYVTIGRKGSRLFRAGISVITPITEPTADILQYKFNEGSGTTLTADVGPNGTTSGGSGYVTGADSVAVHAFDFGGDTTATSDSVVTYGVNVITVTFWAYNTAWETGTQPLLNSSGGTSTANTWLIDDDEGTIRCIFRGTTVSLLRYESFPAPSNNAWHHIAVVFDGSTADGEITVYVDGAVQSTSLLQADRDGTSHFGAETIYIGNASGPTFWNRYMDDVRIYGSALSAGQIGAVYANPE